jgi:predicted lipoprotein with Yx(FWY)xxD motif
MTVREGAVFNRSARIAALLAAVLVCAGAAVALARSTGAVVTTHQGKLGRMLASRSGYTLYLFVHDSSGKSTCNGTCAKAWPPDLTRGKPSVASGSGVNSKLLGTTKRTNGTYQVTYNGHPLYLYAGDKQTGTMHGEAQNQFGGRWYVVSTAGKALKPRLSTGFNPGSY